MANFDSNIHLDIVLREDECYVIDFMEFDYEQDFSSGGYYCHGRIRMKRQQDSNDGNGELYDITIDEDLLKKLKWELADIDKLYEGKDPLQFLHAVKNRLEDMNPGFDYSSWA